MYIVDTRHIDKLVQIKSIGNIPSMGDNYHDGILAAHNDKYFITYYTEVCRNDKCQQDPFNGCCNGYESIYLVYKMDDTLRYLLDTPKELEYHHISMNLYFAAEWFVKEHRYPIGWMLERDLERD